jgi:Recombination endonuclease VII
VAGAGIPKRQKEPRCGEPAKHGPCARPLGHPGKHNSLTSPSHSVERVRERVRRAARRRMGIDVSEHDEVAMTNGQGGRCAICGERRPLHGPTGLYVDHDHVTKQVRGLVCPPCNHAIGLMLDDPGRLRKAADYLERCRRIPQGFAPEARAVESACLEPRAERAETQLLPSRRGP